MSIAVVEEEEDEVIEEEYEEEKQEEVKFIGKCQQASLKVPVTKLEEE